MTRFLMTLLALLCPLSLFFLQGEPAEESYPTEATWSAPEANLPPTISAEAVFLIAEQGVTSNAEWAPYIGIQGVTERDFDGVTMVLVPKGCFDMGSTTGDSDEQPVHEHCFDEPFWIDKTEVTNGQYGSSGRWSGDDYPRESVNWFDSMAHCQNRGGSLPTEKQWEYAARGPDALAYPWGQTFVAENVVYDGNSSRTAPVGSRPAGRSWVGVLDMSGNVWEWASSLYDAYPYTEAREDNSNRTDARALRGGSWYLSGDYLRAANRSRVPSSVTDSGGFRCVRAY